VTADAQGRLARARSRGVASGTGNRTGPFSQSKGTGTRAGAEAGAGRGAGAKALASWMVAGLTGLTLSVGLVLAGTSGVAGASHAKVVKVGTADIAHVGVVLTTGSGLTLYHFTADPPGKVTCTGACARIYPPFTAPKGAHISAPKGVKGLSLISAGHGHWQVAFHDAALYRFAGDTKKGQAKAQGELGKWFVAMKSGIERPGASPVVTVPPSKTTTPPPDTTGTTAPPATTTPPAAQPAPAVTTSPAPTPATVPAPTTTTPPPTTTPPTTPPTTTTTLPAGGGGGGVGF
jgi:predicted lipoprotein with Yx(FWY)xxD motif